jgi:hemolysin activation/secretion protein
VGFKVARRVCAAIAVGTGIWLTADAGAQPLPQIPDWRGTGQALPEPRPAPRRSTRAPQQAAAPSPPAPGPALLVLRGVRLEGATVLAKADFDALAAPYLGRPLGAAEIETIRRGATQLYIDRGFITSGVVIPNQTITDGVLTLAAVEGRITDITVQGAKTYRAGFFERRLERALTQPVQLPKLERAQQLLLQEPYVRRLDLDLQPGAEPGAARLAATVEERSRWGLGFELGNTQSPDLGRARGQVQGSVGNLWGNGDVLALRYGRIFNDGNGLNDYGAGYTLPLFADGTRMSVSYDRSNRALATEPIRTLGIRSEYDSLSFGISRPFWQTPEQTLTLGLALDRRRARNFLLDEPFDFVAGSKNGRTNVTAIRFTQDWLDRNADRVIALRSTFSLGVSWLGATDPETDLPGQARPRFFAWLGQAQYVRRIFGDAEFVTRASLQLSDDPLYSIEQFYVGGLSTVRGYREGLFSADNAFVGTVELRIPLLTLPVPFLSREPTDGVIQLVPFVDRGTGWNTRRENPAISDITGIGGGLRWLVGSGILAEAYLGAALRNVNVGNSLQDQGFHFRITVSVF